MLNQLYLIMRIAYFIIVLALTVSLIIILDRPMGSVPPIGKFISPQHGFWAKCRTG